MRIRAGFPVVLLLAAATGRGAGGNGCLVLATYNLENYCRADRMTGEGYRSDYPKPEAEKLALRSVIRRLNADVLALQEMGGWPYLEELRRDLRAEGLDYPHAALVEAQDADRHVALLSRPPFLKVVPHPDLEFAYRGGTERVKRGLLEATIPAPGGGLTLYVVHLKSHLTEHADDPEAAGRRTAESVAIRDCILRHFKDPGRARFVVMGDFNDPRGSAALLRIEKRGQVQVSWRLPAADTRGETWTELWRRQDAYAQLDHILVSAALRGNVRGGAALVYDGPGTDGASDHRPLVATITFP